MNDFGAGYYFSEPKDARGVDLEREGRDRMAKPENQHLFADGLASDSRGNTFTQINNSKASAELPKLEAT